MKMIQGALAGIFAAVVIYLLVTHGSDVAQLISSSGNTSVNVIKALQGR